MNIPNTVSQIGDHAFGYYYTITDYSYSYVKNEDFTIYGIKNSPAEIYATENGFTFIPIEDEDLETGDTNSDGYININDVTAIQRHLADMTPFNDEQLALADTNADGAVTIEDATHLQMYLAEYDVKLG